MPPFRDRSPALVPEAGVVRRKGGRDDGHRRRGGGRKRFSRKHRPDAARRFPFQADRSVGLLVLEEIEHAQKRGAKIYAEIVGSGSSNSINPSYEHIEPDGKGIETAIRKALADAQIRPEQIDLIIPHGTGIAEDDRAEAQAIQNALGEAAGKIPVWPTKSMVSNTGAGAGALDVIAAAKAIDEYLRSK